MWLQLTSSSPVRYTDKGTKPTKVGLTDMEPGIGLVDTVLMNIDESIRHNASRKALPGNITLIIYVAQDN